MIQRAEQSEPLEFRLDRGEDDEEGNAGSGGEARKSRVNPSHPLVRV